MFCYLNSKVQSIFFNLKTIRKSQKKLSDPSTSSKCYWFLLKTLLMAEKVPVYHHFFTITNLLLTSKKEQNL